MRGPAQLATYIGVGMALLGFVLIGLAWNGAAELDFIQGQFPYVLSGGLGGLGLIIAGMAVLGIQTQRTLTARRVQEMGRLQDEVDALLRVVVQPGPGEFVEDETVVDVGAQTVVRTVSRKPLEDGSVPGASPSQDVPAEGFAPKPRGAHAEAAQEPSTVAVLPREDDEGHAAWAPKSDESEQQQIRALLADVSGVGPAKQDQLAEHFGSVAALRDATAEELADVPGISLTLAKRIQAALR